MAECETRYFGTVSFDQSSVVTFPTGLPGFAHCRQFLPLEQAARRPLIFLQSLEHAQLCFLVLPVSAVDPGYQLKASSEDLAVIGLERQPGISGDVECWVVLAFGPDHAPSVNLLAPLVINRANGLAVQAVRDDSVYSCRHPLASEMSACS